MTNKILYQHRRKGDNSIFYVGIGYLQRASDPRNRNRWWRNIVAKCGYDIEILEVGLTWEEAAIKEIELIAKLGRKDLRTGPLVNLTSGGEGIKGRVWTDEQRKAKSNFMKLNGNCLPKIPSESTKAKMSLAKLGNSNRKGSLTSEKARENLRLNKLGKPTSNHQKLTASKTFSKPVLQYDLEGNFLKEWSSQKEAYIALNLNKNIISNICRGAIHGTHPYKWVFKIQ